MKTLINGQDDSCLADLFLSKDCLGDYLNQSSKWNYVILTASNNHQAEGFRKQLELRNNYLPLETNFVIIPDKDGKRIGSGGATLEVLKYIYEREGTFDGLRILVIHSGGDSKRIPQYSILGKMFAPIPHELPDGRSSTLFDELMIRMSSVPSRIGEGMVLLSGDVLLLFDPLQIFTDNQDVTAISFKEHVEIGKNHGVYLNGENGNVKRYIHKKPVDILKQIGAVDDYECVDIDTGALIFSTNFMKSLYSLIDTEEKYNTYVNETVRLSIYNDFLYPLASDSTLEEFYTEQPEGEFCDELIEARKNIWSVLRKYNLKLLCLSPAKFIHLGTSKEILKLMSKDITKYKNLGWNPIVNSSVNMNVACYNSIISNNAIVGENCYLEVSYVHSNAVIGNNVILSFIEIDNEVVPDNVILHGMQDYNGKFIVRILSINDNPKENKIFGLDLDKIANKLGIQLWNTDIHTLWNANLYVKEDTMKDAVHSALYLYDMIVNDNTRYLQEWSSSDRCSLCSGLASISHIEWNNRMADLVKMDKIIKAIENKTPVSSLEKISKLTKNQEEWIDEQLHNSNVYEKIRLHYYLGVVLDSESEYQACFNAISLLIIHSSMNGIIYNENARIVKNIHTVSLPLRVNFGGGWSDTPPYCNENGGTVLNCSILLNGKKPVEVTMTKIPEKKIVFDSVDMNIRGEFNSINTLQSTIDPLDPFALQKACLIACGIIPKEGHSLDEILTRLGGGFEIRSDVSNVPNGSGLGTSSILATACVKAIFEFMGIEYTDNYLYDRVLVVEQIMSTGGGWQDQVGGATQGVKYIVSAPGATQKLKVTHVKIPEETKRELNDRFVLIYTGQRRLAKNILRNVMGRYIGNEADTVYALKEIQKVSNLMKYELEHCNVDKFSELLNKHWELSKMIDSEISNDLIERIFTSIDDLIDGKFICGAGGGGFLQVITKKGITKDKIEERLKSIFGNSSIGIVECELLF